MRMNIREEEDILMFAFRYALGRQTGAVDTVVSIIERNWDILHKDTKQQMKDEIIRYKNMYSFSEIDYPSWERILNKEIR